MKNKKSRAPWKQPYLQKLCLSASLAGITLPPSPADYWQAVEFADFLTGNIFYLKIFKMI